MTKAKSDMGSPFCLTDEFFPYLSEEDQAGGEARLLEWSRQGRGPGEYMKIGSQRNKAHWNRHSVWQWFKNRYGVLRPDLLKKLEDLDAGFGPTPAPLNWSTNRKTVPAKPRKRAAKAKP